MMWIRPLFILFQIVYTVQAYSYSAQCTAIENGMYIHVSYDPAYQICCGQRLSQRTADVDCCNGKELYFRTTDICCNGQVSKKRVSKLTMEWDQHCEQDNNPNCTELMCCGKHLLVKEEDSYCCDGTEIKLTSDQVNNKASLSCCRKTAYNVFDELCCGGYLSPSRNIGCCNGDIYNTKKFRCDRETKMEKTEGFCGSDSIIYDRYESRCCGDQLVENVPEIIKEANGLFRENSLTKCCGNFVIPHNETCCEERHTGYPTHSIPKQKGLICCGKGYYNKATQLCLDGAVYDKSPYHIQCGRGTIDTRVQRCCANKLPYNSSSEECCEGADYCVIKKGEKCCNGLQMKGNEFCCEDIKPCKKREDEDDDCCFDHERSNGQTFKKGGLLTCNYGQIVKIPEGHLLCGRDSINPSEYFCCNEKKYKHGNGQCCNGVYSNIPPEEGRCCSYTNMAYKFGDKTNPCMEVKDCNKKQKYDVFNELCCEGRIHKKTDHNYCCGTEAIDSSRECCGGRFSYRPGGPKECCDGMQVYHKKYYTCNKGKLEYKGDLRGLSDGQRLCHRSSLKLFDGGIQHACLRKHAILGKITSVAFDGVLLKISLRVVKTLTTNKLPRRITFNIHIAMRECDVGHLKRLKKVIVLFDEEVSNKNVDISKDSSIFITPRTSQRYYSIVNTISSTHCNLFS